MTADTLVQTQEPVVEATKTVEDDSAKTCREMIANLEEDELEHAARSSYRYFMQSARGEASKEDRERLSLAMANRHLVAEKGDATSALKKMKGAIQYRRDVDVDGIRRCFYDLDNEETKEKYAEYREHLENAMGPEGSRFVQGYDKKDRALYISLPRLDNFDEGDWVIKSAVYTLERTIAASERSTDGAEEKVNAFFNYNGYSLRNSPPVSLTKELMEVLRDHYPERLDNVFIVDAPLIFRAFYKIIYPFIDKITRRKVKFVTGEEQKRQVLSEHIAEDQAADWMYEAGTNNTPLDRKKFLYDLPFDRAFNEGE